MGSIPPPAAAAVGLVALDDVPVWEGRVDDEYVCMYVRMYV